MPTNNITIIKIGTKTLIDDHGNLRVTVLENILENISQRLRLGDKIVLVSSGAVATGRKVLGEKLAERSVAAGVGQPALLGEYIRIAQTKNLNILEILLARPHLIRREQFLVLQNRINQIFAHNNILPVVNENDFLVADSDWSFGDNDSLAAALAIALRAQKLIIMSHVGGLYSGDPGVDANAHLIKQVDNVNAELMKYCSKNASDVGRGGMISKLKTARLCSAVGITTQIINGMDKDEVKSALFGEEAGTIIRPRIIKGKMKNRDRWILSAKSSVGSIEVDAGAIAALHLGKSLLAVGIKKIHGDFNAGEIVEIINGKQEGVAFGLVDIDSKILNQKKLGAKQGVQVMHADNIMVFA